MLKHYDMTQDPKINFYEYLDYFMENRAINSMGKLVITWIYLSISTVFLFFLSLLKWLDALSLKKPFDSYNYWQIILVYKIIKKNI